MKRHEVRLHRCTATSALPTPAGARRQAALLSEIHALVPHAEGPMTSESMLSDAHVLLLPNSMLDEAGAQAPKELPKTVNANLPSWLEFVVGGKIAVMLGASYVKARVTDVVVVFGPAKETSTNCPPFSVPSFP